MARKSRHTPAGYVYHFLNRAVGRIALFRRDQDYAAFERILLAPWPVDRPHNWLIRL